MDSVRDWDVKTDGEAPKILHSRKNFTPTKAVHMTDDEGNEFYGLTDGKITLPLKIVKKSQARIDAEEAARPAEEAAAKAFADARVAADSFKTKLDAAALVDDAEWAKLSDRDALDHVRKLLLGSLGLQTGKPELVAKANDALAAAADAVADVGPALEVKP